MDNYYRYRPEGQSQYRMNQNQMNQIDDYVNQMDQVAPVYNRSNDDNQGYFPKFKRLALGWKILIIVLILGVIGGLAGFLTSYILSVQNANSKPPSTSNPTPQTGRNRPLSQWQTFYGSSPDTTGTARLITTFDISDISECAQKARDNSLASVAVLDRSTYTPTCNLYTTADKFKSTPQADSYVVPLT